MKNIKYLLIVAICSLSLAVQSQDDGGATGMRFGLTINSGGSWLTIDKGQDPDGLGFVIGGGLITEFRISDYVSFVTGASMVNYGVSVKYTDDVNFIYQSEDNGITQPADTSLLLSRRYFFKTVQLPLKLKLKTPEIGYLTYFAEIGIVGNLNYDSFTKKNTIQEGTVVSELSGSLDEIDANEVTNWYRTALSVNLGFEYSLVGNTALVVSLNWEHGLSNVLRDDNLNKTKLSFASTGEVFKQTGALGYGGLSVAIMF
ncbi:MAG: hypothetical protein ACJAZ2_002381 [Glaciecola sp.]|jgi:hypothetical protein